MVEESAPSVLIIEDDEETSRMLEILLARDGFNVSVSRDGTEGLKVAKKKKPDLVILDIMMPGKTGIEVMEDMRLDFRTKDIPILFLSAVHDEETIVKALRGGDDYILKPFKPLELRERVHKILMRRLVKGAEGVDPESQQYNRVPVQIGNETYLVPYREIYYAEASGKYTYIQTHSRRYLSSFSISELEERLSGYGHFLRIHRSYIVNFDHIHMIRKDSPQNVVVVLGDEAHSELRVSSSRYPRVKGLLGL